MQVATEPSPTVIGDSHVHFYECFDLDRFLDSAARNFQARLETSVANCESYPVLMLSEAKNHNWFNRVKANRQASTRWKFVDTEEAESFFLENDSGVRILVVGGRQIVTAENLEVLSLATAEELADGLPTGKVVEWAIAAGAIPVLPWGFGKWWGKRGKVVSEVLDNFAARDLFLGDNSGRAGILGTPKHFERAESEHRRILPGSDPLPFAREAWRPGSVGFYFSGSIDQKNPARSLRKYLRSPDTSITMYMSCERILPFLKNQISMQLRNRL